MPSPVHRSAGDRWPRAEPGRAEPGRRRAGLPGPATALRPSRYHRPPLTAQVIRARGMSYSGQTSDLYGRRSGGLNGRRGGAFAVTDEAVEEVKGMVMFGALAA